MVKQYWQRRDLHTCDVCRLPAQAFTAEGEAKVTTSTPFACSNWLLDQIAPTVVYVFNRDTCIVRFEG